MRGFSLAFAFFLLAISGLEARRISRDSSEKDNKPDWLINVPLQQQRYQLGGKQNLSKFKKRQSGVTFTPPLQIDEKQSLSNNAEKAKKTGKRDSDTYSSWTGLQNCQDRNPNNDPCVKCNCDNAGADWNGQNYWNCTMHTKRCFKGRDIHCVDSVKSPGQCCPTCPNGENCRIQGKIVKPDVNKKYFTHGDDSEYKRCDKGGLVVTCKITKDGMWTRTKCKSN